MLGCLAGAMTGITGWLGWIEPSVPAGTPIPSHDMILRHARSLVSDKVAVRGSQWKNIEIFAGPGQIPGPPFLTAVPDRCECHFLVDLEGRTWRTWRWSSQEPSPGLLGTVRIQVVRSKMHQPMSRIQWERVQALVLALRELVAVKSGGLPVRLHEELARAYGLEPGVMLDIPPRAVSRG